MNNCAANPLFPMLIRFKEEEAEILKLNKGISLPIHIEFRTVTMLVFTIRQ
jgi:hypothetical protein